MPLGPIIGGAKDNMQSQSSLPRSLIDAMAEANFFQLFVPKTIGEPETDPITTFRAVEALSSADGLVGWCPFVAVAFSVYSASLPAKVANELFGQSLDIRGAGSFQTTADVRSVDGGYSIGEQSTSCSTWPDPTASTRGTILNLAFVISAPPANI